jgi:hypothetical protein
MAVVALPQQDRVGEWYMGEDAQAEIDACIMNMMQASGGLYIEALRVADPDMVRRAVAQAIPAGSEG